MITLDQFNNAKYFWLYNLEDIIIGHAESMMVSVSVSINATDTTVFAETLYAEDDGNVVLHNIAELLEPYFDDQTRISVIINSVQGEIFYSRRCLPDIEVSQFEQTLPMVLNAAKTYYATLKDTLHVKVLLPKNASSIKVDVDCYGMDNQGHLYVESHERTLSNSANYPQAASLDLTMEELFASRIMSQFTPYGISISDAGKQLAQVCMVNDDNKITLEYRNNFNVLTLLTIPGALQYKPDYNRILGKVFGRAMTIRAGEEMKHTFLCGPVGEDEIIQLMDAASSTECYYIDSNGKHYEIAMDDPDIEFSSIVTEFVTPKLTFNRSRNPAALIYKT